MKYVQKISGPFLVIVPLSVLTNWMNEFKKFLPQMRVLMLHSGDLAEKERLKKEVLPNLLNTHDVVVTTYDMAKHPAMKHSLISSYYWRCVILDEGHIVRNENSNIAQAIRKMHFEQALLLTGTPLQNNLHELWSLLNFLQPEIFPESNLFDECFDITNSANYKIDKAMLLKVHAMLKPFMLRRIKADVEKTVPPKVEKKILCPLSAVQSSWYKRFLLKDSTLLMQLELEDYDASKEGGDAAVAVSNTAQQSRWRRLNMLFVQLRKVRNAMQCNAWFDLDLNIAHLRFLFCQVCNHPFLFPEADPHPEFTDASIIAASGKLQVLDKLLLRLQAEGHRVVLFSQFTGVLDILVDYLNLRGFLFCRLDGSTNRVQRQIHINSFNRPRSPLFVFLMSTRAGGLGVNLQTADTVILYDSDWNPQVRTVTVTLHCVLYWTCL
jgi:SWI/SNF-related matrix-associated actin-dependent regulator of chromatin subfamily A member 5